MNPYYTAAFILCVLLVTHPNVHRWIRERVEDVREAMREENSDE